MDIELDFKEGDCVIFNIAGGYPLTGYIVGFKYTNHCYLEKPKISYAIMENIDYSDYKEGIANGATPFQHHLWWKEAEDIELINKVN